MSDQSMDYENLDISIPRMLVGDILNIARQSNRSVSQIIEKALIQYLNDDQSISSVYLSAPVNAMLKGFYEENTMLGDLKKHGDFGLGTFNNLNGEMVMLDGIIYQLHADGKTYPVEDHVQTHFACVTFYSPTVVEEIEGNLDFNAFNAMLNRLLPSDNMLYAIRVDGLFEQVKVWSVASQPNYQPLSEDEQNRPVFEYDNIEGVLASFYTPKFIRALNFPGFHLHFLTADRKFGGHLHECRTERIQIGIQFIHQLKLDLPITLDYLTANLPR